MGKHRRRSKGKKPKEEAVHDFVDDWGENVVDQVVEDAEDENEGAIKTLHLPTRKAKENGNMYRIQSHSALSTLPQAEQRASSREGKRSRDRPKGNSRHSRGTHVICEKCKSKHDMPMAHFAAYKGHYTCLELILQSESIVEYDKQQRTPLFYACAANRVDCCTLILLKRSDWIDLADNQLDTVAHVCCFFGWSECLERVLHAGANPHARNSKGFFPSHIAKNEKCLELLLSNGDDLLQGDQLGRSPLFVACARNRASCVAFLCAWNYQTNAWMLEQTDERGDHPLHAAACNGCTACVQILIEYGANIATPNAKGLTPLDLAHAGNHNETIQALLDIQSTQKQQSTIDPEWTECFDSNTNQVFYYNKTTGRCQWDRPEQQVSSTAEVWRNQEGDTTYSDEQTQQIYNSVVTDDPEEEYVWVKKKKENIQVLAGTSQWRTIQDPSTKAIYYKNEKTGETQWEEPEALERIQREATAHASHHASELWDELNKSRETFANVLEVERSRQLAATRERIKEAEEKIVYAWSESTIKVAAFKFKSLIATSSFRRHGSMLKILGGGGDIESLCEQCPMLELFLMTHLQPHIIGKGAADGPESTGTDKILSSIFHYYACLEDPINPECMSKSQFRKVLKEAKILPAKPTDRDAPLKLHVADLVYVQANRSINTTISPDHNIRMDVQRFLSAMEMIGERVITVLEADIDEDIEDTDKWLADKYLIPLMKRLAAGMGKFVRLCKSVDDSIASCNDTRDLIDLNRKELQSMYNFYSGIESNFKLMTFHDMVHFAKEFSIIPNVCDTYQLYQVFESTNWISANSHTVAISYVKFLRMLSMLPILFPEYTNCDPIDRGENRKPINALVQFLNWLDTTDGKQQMSKRSRGSAFTRLFKYQRDEERAKTQDAPKVSEEINPLDVTKDKSDPLLDNNEPLENSVEDTSIKKKTKLRPIKHKNHKPNRIVPVDEKV